MFPKWYPYNSGTDTNFNLIVSNCNIKVCGGAGLFAEDNEMVEPLFLQSKSESQYWICKVGDLNRFTEIERSNLIYVDVHCLNSPRVLQVR